MNPLLFFSTLSAKYVLIRLALLDLSVMDVVSQRYNIVDYY